MWPDFFPRTKRDRLIAFIVPMGNTAYEIRCVNDWIFFAHSYGELKSIMLEFKLELYTFKLRKFIWLKDAINDINSTVSLANSSKQIVSISIKGKKNRQVKIVSTAGWGYNKEPDMKFLGALATIFTDFDYGIHPSQGSLGQNALKAMLYPGKDKPLHRYSRPADMLRRKLIDFGSGGRADDFSLYEEYEVAYENDFNNHYAEQAKLGVPVDGYERFGLTGVPSDDLSVLGEFRLSYVECWITIPDGSIRKFSPFYIRGDDGLQWATLPGRYHGYYFSPVVKAILDAGYRVEIGAGWGWSTLDKFLVPFIEKAIALREKYKAEGNELCAQLVKGMIVATLGRFGMRPYRLELVDKEHKQDEDEMFLAHDYVPAVDGSPTTGLYIHKVVEMDSPNLTQVLYWIISQANLALYYRCLAEEESGNTVIMTNFDALILEQPSILDQQGLKQKTYKKLRPLGRRSFKHADGQVTPGVKRN
jgi:hypothetical protein